MRADDQPLLSPPTHMTHSRVLELAGRMAQHGAWILSHCRGIPVAALRRHLKARKTQCAEWSQLLAQTAPSGEGSSADAPFPPWEAIRPAFEEIATGGVLLRVASTVLHGIGKQLDIPLAIDVATQSARAFDSVVQRAMGFIALRSDLSCSQLVALDRLGQMADRMSDLLCGALLPALKCDRYLVDRERAKDFAETFGRNPELVRVPLQYFMKRLPDHLLSACAARAVERSLVACLPTLASTKPPHPAAGQPVSQTGKRTQATELRVVSPNESHLSPPNRLESTFPPISFPSHSFAISRRRLKDSTRE